MSLRILHGRRSPLQAPTGAPVWNARIYPSVALEFPELFGFEPAGAPKPVPRIKSGPHWVGIADDLGWTNSTSVDDLSEPFKTSVQEFIAALKRAGAVVHCESTLRHPARAWLMHHAWAIAEGRTPPSEDPHGSGIEWHHDTPTMTQDAAKRMVEKFRMRHIAVLNSMHLDGLAIDMTISWSGVLKITCKDGTEREIKSSPRNGLNKELTECGKTFGVYKLFKDPPDEPHWHAPRR